MSRRSHLLRYLGARLALAPLMLGLIASLVFLLLRVAPGDPIDALLGPKAPAAARAALRQQLGLDQPLLDQYGHFLSQLLHGDLGLSQNSQEPVLGIIRASLPASLELGVVALLLAAVLGLAVGFSGIARPEGKLDLAGRLFGIGTYALPPFWAAMVVQLVFAVWLGWLPVGGRFPPTLLPPKPTPWKPRSRPMKRVRCASPRARAWASAIFIAVSQASLPLLTRNTRSSPGGASAAMRSASANAPGWPTWKLEAKSSVSICRFIASAIFGWPWPAPTHHRPEVPSSTSRPSAVR